MCITFIKKRKRTKNVRNRIINDNDSLIIKIPLSHFLPRGLVRMRLYFAIILVKNVLVLFLHQIM